MKSIIISFIFALFLSLVAATPANMHVQDVFSPPVLTPNSESVWKIGTEKTVTWDVSHPPKQITNTKARIVLAKGGSLDFHHPLAKDLDILVGLATVTVPEVIPGDDYQIIVYGDSANAGQFFSADPAFLS